MKREEIRDLRLLSVSLSLSLSPNNFFYFLCLLITKTKMRGRKTIEGAGVCSIHTHTLTHRHTLFKHSVVSIASSFCLSGKDDLLGWYQPVLVMYSWTQTTDLFSSFSLIKPPRLASFPSFSAMNLLGTKRQTVRIETRPIDISPFPH